MIKKLRNKGTGKIGYLYANKDANYQVLDGDDCVLGVYDTLPRLIEEWEDYKLNIWYNSMISGRYTIEIDFATDKEAKKALDKFNAWQRLKDKGFKFVGWCDSVSDNNPDMALFKLNEDAWETDTCEDLDTCFGGEE